MTYYWLVRAFRRWWWLCLCGLVLGLLGGIALSILSPKTYDAVIRLQFSRLQNPGIPTDGDLSYNDRLAASYGVLLKSQPLLEETIAQLSLPLPPETLKKRIAIHQLSGAQSLEIVVTDTDRNRATAIATKLSQLLITQVQDTQTDTVRPVKEQVDRDLADARQRMSDTSARLDQLRATPTASADALIEAMRLHDDLLQYQAIYLSLLQTQQRMQLDQAQIASSLTVAFPAYIIPTSRLSRYAEMLPNILTGGALGILLTAGFAGIRELRDRRLRDLQELHQRGIVPLTSLPFVAKGLSLRESSSLSPDERQYAEGIRLLRARLFTAGISHPKVIGISSALRGEGVSSVAAFLGLAAAQANQRVILVDAHLRAPGLHHLFHVEDDPGLSAYLQQNLATAPPIQSGPRGIGIITGGAIPPDPAGLLASPKMATLVLELRAEADLVILDLPPILAVADTLALQPLVDGVVLVLDSKHTVLPMLDRASELLRQAGGEILGVVVNNDAAETRMLSHDDTYDNPQVQVAPVAPPIHDKKATASAVSGPHRSGN